MTFASRNAMARLRCLLATLCAAAVLVGAPPASAGPALWVIRDADSTLYLFGTMHALKAGMAWRTKEIDRAFAESEELILEVVLPDDPAAAQALARTYGFDPAGSLSAKLEPADRERLAAAVRALGAPPQAVERMRPWLAAASLGAVPMTKAGWSSAAGVEAVLTAEAKAARKRIFGLETAEQQMRMMADLPEATQLKALSATLAQSDEGLAKLEAAATAWAAGDLHRLEADAAALRVGRDLVVDEAVRGRRNKAWAEQIEAKLAGAGTSFIAVGAGHFVGPGSLHDALASRGIQVKRN